MDNQKKLELTLCGMLPYGLIMHYTLEGKPFRGTKKRQILTHENYELLSFSTKRKPELHSLSKLTEPILEGNKTPLAELAKLIDAKFRIWSDIQKYPTANDGEFGYYISRDLKVENFVSFFFENGCFYFDSEIEILFPRINQLQLFEKLKEWHFNIYDLPKEMYIEKSESNGK